MRRLFALAATLLVVACYPGSDAQVAARASRREGERRLRSMKSATAETARGQAIPGAALHTALAGKTHVFSYPSRPGGGKGRYVEHYYFAPDGHLAYTNSLWALEPAGRAEDHWWIDGDRLCLLNSTMNSQTQCFLLARIPEGRLQYFIATPGSEYDGLLTKVTDAVLDGSPPAPRIP